ncbi:MAG: adenine phosphoribosyltransferase [Clostridia bacterium]|nr:adenine phosphoribosyltransferase [Clostridia bacterium]
MKKTSYTMEIAGLSRTLPICKLNDELYIGAFVMFGDVELTIAAAKELLSRAPEYDIMITAESKGIPLLYEMARQSGQNNYIVARKGPKLYMQNIHTTYVNSITTEKQQSLCLGEVERRAMEGKRVLIVDDVISTGESLLALEALVGEVGGNIVGKMAVLAEGDAIERDDIIYLSPLPLFDKEGNPIS